MKKLKNVLADGDHGLYYGCRVLLPFQVHVLKAVIENDIITDFSRTDRAADYTITDDYTEIYFHDYKDLKEFITKYEMIKLVVVQKGDDIFDTGNHKKISLKIKDRHKLEINELDEDIIFVE